MTSKKAEARAREFFPGAPRRYLDVFVAEATRYDAPDWLCESVAVFAVEKAMEAEARAEYSAPRPRKRGHGRYSR
jgi:hypothetical protein